MTGRVLKRGLYAGAVGVALFVGMMYAPAAAQSPPPTVTKTWLLQTDVNSNGLVDPGDTIQYTITITPAAGGGTATGVSFSDPIPDPNTALVVGSVTVSGGTSNTVILGNTTGDTAVGVQVGDITSSATITFDVTVKNPLPVGVNQVANQGAATCDECGTGVPTDDPNTVTVGDPTITPVNAAPAISATKAVALLVDQNSNGQVNPGDILLYTVVITNTGDQDAGGVIFSETIPAPTQLLVGSVTTTAGVIVSGNNPGDTTVNVQIPLLAGSGGSVTITYQTQVKPLIGFVDIVNQGTVTGGNFPPTVTDDPTTAAPNDPTAIPAFGPTPVPALGMVGLLLLTSFLATVAAFSLRRRLGRGA